MDGLTIIEDTRQQAGKHDEKHEGWAAAGVAVIRSKLTHGDYALPPVVSVDTKKDIYELAMDMDKEHERFRAELVGARDVGTQLVILVENADGVASLQDLAGWSETERHFRMRKSKSGNPRARKIEGERLAKACLTMQRKYGARFEFCRPEEAAARVVQILMEGGGRGADDA